jgi:hypothetical protein
MADRVITATGPRGRLFACIAPSVRFTTGKVADVRFCAFLNPFADEEAARAALVAAGGENLKEEVAR